MIVKKGKKNDQFNIIHEDDYLIVISKPSGIVVNISNTSQNLTLQDFIQDHVNFEYPEPLEELTTLELEEYMTDLNEFRDRSGILHRLDKDTSGILLVAKTFDSFKKFKHLFKEREMHKEYLAVVIGDILDEKIEIDAPIKRNPKNPMKFAVVSEGKPAVTLLEKVKKIDLNGEIFTSIKAYPKTGRTHQIRVHLTAINHPVASDPIYLTRHGYANSTKYFNRLMLHAKSLRFIHPYFDKEVIYETDIPLEFKPYF